MSESGVSVPRATEPKIRGSVIPYLENNCLTSFAWRVRTAEGRVRVFSASEVAIVVTRDTL